MNFSKRSFATLLFFVFFVSGINAQSDNPWKLTKNKDGIKTYTRHSADSPIKEVMGVMKLKTSLSSIIALLKDAENQKNWIYLNKTASLLSEPSNFEWYYYSESDAPWPVSNRDIVSHVVLRQNVETHALRIENVGEPDYIAIKKGIVRVRNLKSSWDFVPEKDGVVRMKFQIFIDIGGNIPAWIINMAVDTGPFNTLAAMSEQLKKDKYKNAKVSYIKEKP